MCPSSTSLMFTTAAMQPACTTRVGLSGPESHQAQPPRGAAGRGACPPPANNTGPKIHLVPRPQRPPHRLGESDVCPQRGDITCLVTLLGNEEAESARVELGIWPNHGLGT